IQRFDDERLAVVGLSHAAKTDDHIIGLHSVGLLRSRIRCIARMPAPFSFYVFGGRRLPRARDCQPACRAAHSRVN
ncbi:hypothetical protein, partial [Burkholderia multivorans]|uniref:hypothetical protein n=1 Tax=Burkholderia multivorans TaxID=87883 RepID=UPI001C615777